MHLTSRLTLCVLSILSFQGILNPAAAETVIPGLTFSVADRFTEPTDNHVGSHLHSSNTDPPAMPALPLPGIAEAGGFFGDEEVRAIAEFDLSGQPMAQSAMLKFDVRDMTLEAGSEIGGLFGQGSYRGILHLVAFAGNQEEDITDFEATPFEPNPVATIDTTPLSAGDTISHDVTSLFNANLDQSLGFRIQLPESDADAGAITFENFRITPVPVPEPAAGTLSLCGVLAMMIVIRRRRH